ncbi:MAG: Gfo/Idh/MocA family oxidoreductase [Verrucomicrobiaceae bacterium]|nr:Gfo/Idh/MocA family oxidoreductase [Verrucomicrobiaceae bacterium]
MATKIGIIGAGGMARYHIDGFRKAGAEVVAMADISVEAATISAKANQIEHVFDDVAALLASDLDAVSIIVPNKFHGPLAVQALEAGKHVFCEKPPALNAAEVREMIAARDRVGKELMFNFNNRARPESHEMKKRIENGTVGRINSAQAKWIRRTGIPGFGGWFTTKALSGGGPVIDLLHMLDLALYFMGNPEPAHVIGQTFDDHIDNKDFKGPWGIPDREGGTTDVESAAHGFVTFRTGQVLAFQMSWAEMVKREEVSVVFQGVKAGGKIERLFGSDGLDETAIDTCELYTQESGERVDTVIEVEECPDMGRIDSAANFVEAIEGRALALNTAEQGLQLMQIIDAVYESAATGRPVAI